MKEKRFERYKKIIIWLKKNPSIVKIFSDEKIFTVDAVLTVEVTDTSQSLAEVKETFKTKVIIKNRLQIPILSLYSLKGVESKLKKN